MGGRSYCGQVWRGPLGQAGFAQAHLSARTLTACLLTGLFALGVAMATPAVKAQEPAPVPPGFDAPQSGMSRELQQVVTTLEDNGCLFGYGAALSHDLMNWREHGCIRVDGTKLDQSQWHLLLEEFSGLDATGTALSLAQALRQLSQLALQTPFQAQTPDSPIQILGVLEGAGLRALLALLAKLLDQLEKSKAAEHYEKWTNRYTLVKAWQFRSGYRF
jgi:hypothetical protein